MFSNYNYCGDYFMKKKFCPFCMKKCDLDIYERHIKTELGAKKFDDNNRRCKDE